MSEINRTAHPTGKKVHKMVSYSKYGYIFLAPFFIIYAFFSLYPLLYTFYLSMTKYWVFGPGQVDGPTFIGLQNFANLFSSGSIVGAETVQAFKNTIFMWVLNFIPQVLLSLLLAAWFTDLRVKIGNKAQGIFKTLFYLPNIITAASISFLFFQLFSIKGPVNQILIDIGVFDKAFMFTDSGKAVRYIIAFINFWMWYGNTTILLIAGIMGINPSFYDSAEIDGATSGQIFRKITLPLLRPILLFTLMTSLIGGMQMYDVPQIMGTNGNVNRIVGYDSIKTVTMVIQNKALASFKDYGVAATISVLLFAVTAVASIALFFVMRDKDAIAERKERKRERRANK